MNRRDALGRAGRVGEDIVKARLAVYAGVGAAAVVGGLALLVVVVLALTGAGPGLGASAVIVVAAAVLGGALARVLVMRLSVLALVAFAARRLGRRRR